MISLTHKSAFRFRVHFDDFGTGDGQLTGQVMRVTRPSVKFHEVYGLDEVSLRPIEIDLRDDVGDMTRSEVITQVIKQIRDDAKFAVVIETLDAAEKVLEQWRLNNCRIIEYHLDELVECKADGLLIHLVIDCARLSVTLHGELVQMLSHR